MTDTLVIFGDEYTGVTGIKATDDNDAIKTYVRPQGTKSITANGTGIDVAEYASVDVAVSGGGGSIPELPVFTVTVNAWGQVTSITCDKTYAECFDILYDSYDGGDAAIVCLVNVSNNKYYRSTAGGFEDDNGNLVYSYISTDGSLYDIRYNTNGTIDQVTPSVMEGSEGTPTATKGTVSNHSVSVTPSVTNSIGFISGGTHSGTPVTVSASELVSGTLTPSNYGTFDVTNYASVQVSGGSAGTPTATKGTVSNHSVSVTPSVTNLSGWITGSTKTGTAVTVSASELVSGSQNITENGTVDVTNLAEVVVNVSGGGGTGMTVATATKTLSTAASSIQFTNLSGQPTSFVVTSSADLSTGGTKAVAVVYDGTSLHGMDLTSQAEADTGYTQSYSGGTLTITATSASFQANAYKLVYTYGGTSANLGTDDVQVGSGATSITFTGLSAEPDYFSCIFKSTFSTSSGYQRVMEVVYDGNSTYGHALDSSAHALTSWSYTYNNGSLTISSTGTNNGGYFHQPGYYQLTYGIGGTVEPTEIEVEPLSVTTNGTYTAPTGKAYSPVTVNVSGGGGVNVDKVTWTNSSTSTVSHTFSNLDGTPKAAFLRCTAQLTRSSSNTYYYIADICWDGTNAYGNYHLRSNGSYNNVAADAASGFNVTTGTNSITFSSDASSRSSAPGSFYNGAYELTYIY